MSPIEFSGVQDEHEDKMKTSPTCESNFAHQEMSKVIDRHLPPKFRHDYNKLRYNIRIPKHRRELLQQTIQEILDKYGYWTQEGRPVDGGEGWDREVCENGLDY